MKRKRISEATLVLIGVSVLLAAANILLGNILVHQSKEAIKTLIDARMLDIANTASDLVDGDELVALTKEDKGTPIYEDINDSLKVFQDNIDLRYIYTVRDMGDGTFTFMVDPAMEDPGEFGEPVVATEALKVAARGKSAVDKAPYEDAWGRFYSAYSPVFTSDGHVGGIVAVDFDAVWYDTQVTKFGQTILFYSVLCVMVGAGIVFVVISQVRKRFEEIKEKQADSMITALASDYKSVYHVDLDKDEGVCFRMHSQLENGLKEGEEFSYLATFTHYANAYVTEEYRAGFIKFIQPEAIRARLAKEVIITYRYLVHRGGKESYEMLRVAGVHREGERGDKTIHVVGVGFSDVDDEMKKSMAQAEALKNALVAAREANRSKTAFLASMSHEMRTPMNAIIGYNKIAQDDPTLSQETRENLEQIGTSAQQLMKLINDILDMSRIESGSLLMKREVFALGEILNTVEITFGGRCRAKGVTWRSSLPPELAGCYIGDGEKLEQAIGNILDNAIRFTPEGGEVDFAVALSARYGDKATLSFTVADTGIGMEEEFLPLVFDVFSQEDSSSANNEGSTGLGLAITKHIVDMMYGTIRVESKKGVGTTVVMTVTLSDASQGQGETAAANAEAKQEIDLAGRRVLIVEDILVNAKMLQKILEGKGMITEHAGNGEIAVEDFAENEPGYYDAILMDLRMPVMDGYEATRTIRAMDRQDAKKIPIIALTANALDEDVRQSLQAGMDAHLSKPADPKEIYTTLEKMIGKAAG